MRRVLTVSAAAACVLGSSVQADGLEEMFKNGKASGQVRLAYIDQDNPAGTADSFATSAGGQLRYETGAWNGLKFGVAAYASQKIDGLSGNGAKLNPDFFDDRGDAFAYIGEAYADFQYEGFALRVGRQQIDTPFADTDDIRMLPNTFEAAIASYTGVEKLTLIGGYVTRWAGFDSGDDISEFKRFAPDSDGAAVVGAVYEGVENLLLQGWYYDIDKIGGAAYADTAYVLELSEAMAFEAAVQGACFDESDASGIDGNAFGAMAAFGFGPAVVSTGYNKASNDTGKAVTNGFGGGPYFTSMEEMTIDGLNDAEAYMVGAELDFADLGIEGLVLAAAYASFESGSGDEADEIDVIVGYALNEQFEAEVSYAEIDDARDTLDGDWSRWLVRLNYNF